MQNHASKNRKSSLKPSIFNSMQPSRGDQNHLPQVCNHFRFLSKNFYPISGPQPSSLQPPVQNHPDTLREGSQRIKQDKRPCHGDEHSLYRSGRLNFGFDPAEEPRGLTRDWPDEIIPADQTGTGDTFEKRI